MGQSTRLLNDSPERSYAAKLERFAKFSAPEFHQIFSDLDLPSRGMALDLGCGTGHAMTLLTRALGSEVTLLGLDLSEPHLQMARLQHAHPLVQCDAERLCFRDEVFDFVWSCNTINHLRDGIEGLKSLRRILRQGGRLVAAQSGFLPEMFFAWDAPLDDAVRLACYEYYRERYDLELSDTAGIRGVVGMMQAADFKNIVTRTYVIERIQPLSPTDRDYLENVIFQGTWGERISPYLKKDDQEKLRRYCHPDSPDYCLNREDFHHLQTLTVCQGKK